MSKTYPWALEVEWLENVGFTPDDSGERGEWHEFTSKQELDEFLFLYRLQHNCVDGEADDWLVREINIYSPQDMYERELRHQQWENDFDSFSAKALLAKIRAEEKNIDK